MLLVLLFLTLLAAITPAKSAEPDAAFLDRLEQLRRVARQAGPQLWPGWDPTATPLAIYKGTGMGVLVGHPSPPQNFRKLAAAAVSAPVFVADSTAGMVRANTAQQFGGVLTSFFSYEEFMDKPAADALALGIHELFHAQENRIAPQKNGNILVVLWGDYPEFSARNRALLALEAELLYRGATAKTPEEAREDVAGFLGIRAERRKDLTPELARYESGEESSEGLARYIEYRTLQLLPGISDAYKDAVSAAAKQLELLKSINGLPRDREKFYALGMAESVLLDRLRPEWKKEYETSPLLLDDLLAEAVPAAPAAETAALMDKLDFNHVLQEQQKTLSDRREEGVMRLTKFVASPGDRVVIEVHGIRNSVILRGFNPNGAIQLSRDQIAHTFLLLDLGAAPGATMRLEFRGAPLIYDRAQEAFWCKLPAETVKKALDAYAQATGSDVGKLSLRGNGFSAEFTGVQVERRGTELRIRPAEDLKRLPDYKPPTIVRP